MTRLPWRPTCTIDGAPLDDDLAQHLAAITVVRSLSRPDTIELRFVDHAWKRFGAISFGMGAQVKLAFDGGGEPPEEVSVFDGEVTGIGSVTPEDGFGPELVVTASDRSHRLDASSAFHAHLDKKASDIVSELAGRHGLSAQVEATSLEHPYLLQRGTDRELLDELAALSDLRWWVDGTTLHFGPLGAEEGPTLTPEDGSLAAFSATYSVAGVPGSLELLGWDVDAQKGMVSTPRAATSRDKSILHTDAAFVSTAAEHRGDDGALGVALHGVAASSAQELDPPAEVVARSLVGTGLRAEGRLDGDPDLRPGTWVTIEGVGERLSGAYLVTEVTHVLTGGEDLRTRFVCDPADSAGQAPSHAPPNELPRVGATLQYGVIDDVADPDALGRVRVWLGGLGGKVSSSWARVVAPAAAAGTGFRPDLQVGDDVVVAFERGDPRHPLVLGAVWGKKHEPPELPEADGGPFNGHTLVSRSKQHLVMDDDAGYAELAHTKGGHSIRIAGDELTVTTGGKPLKLTDGQASIELDGKGNVTIKGASVTIESKGAVKVDAQQDVKLKAAVTAELAGAMVAVKGSSMGEINGGSMLTVKGGMVQIN